jgi:iron complex outermembrane receptor protein
MFQKGVKIFLGVMLIFVAMMPEFGQAQTLNGQVFNKETSKPIPFASIYLTELSTGTISDSAGFFSISNFPSSPTTLKISAIGFGTFTTAITYNATAVYAFYLEPKHVHLDEVIVSTPFGKLQGENVTNVESIRLNELNRIPTLSLSEAIANIPGVYQSSLGNGIGRPVIRGLSGTRVVTYLNGLRIENQQWGDDHGMGVTSIGVNAVEVIKGPASLLYGSDALGGVMYFVNQPYAKLNQFEGYYHTTLESNTLGSSNELGLKWNTNGLKFNVFLGHTFHGDFMMANGSRVMDSRFSSSTGKISIGYNKKNWVGNLHYAFVNSYVGIPGHSHDDSLYAELFYSDKPAWFKTLPYQFITNNYVSLENKFFFEKSQLDFVLGNTTNHLREFEEKVTIPGMDLTLNNSIYNLKWRRDLGKKLQMILGSQGMYQLNKNNPKAEEELIPNSFSADAGIYGLLQLELNSLTFQAGARYDARKIKTESAFNGFDVFDKIYQSYNYSAGFAYQADSLVLRLNISSGFRAPHTSELLANGVHHGTFRYTIGDPNLKTENAVQADFSVGVHYDHLEITFNPFFNQIQNYIYLEPSDTIIDSYQVYRYSQLSKAQLFGGDFSIHAHPHFAHWLHLQSSFSYIYAQDENGNALPLIPQNRINTQVKIEFESDRKFRITDLVIQHSIYFDQNRIGSFETSTSAYNLLHAGLNMQIETKGQPLLLNVGVKNLLNENYIDHLSRLKQIGLIMPGINFYVGLKYNFEKRLKTKNQ